MRSGRSVCFNHDVMSMCYCCCCFGDRLCSDLVDEVQYKRWVLEVREIKSSPLSRVWEGILPSYKLTNNYIAESKICFFTMVCGHEIFNATLSLL